MRRTWNGITYETRAVCCGGPAMGTDCAPDCPAERDLERQIDDYEAEIEDRAYEAEIESALRKEERTR